MEKGCSFAAALRETLSKGNVLRKAGKKITEHDSGEL